MFLHVKLVDVHADGRAHALLFGQRVVDAARRLGTHARSTSAIRAIASLPGHRLRLHVASSDFPVFLPHPGTAENPWDATVTRTNRQALATGGATPSYVSLTGGSQGDEFRSPALSLGSARTPAQRRIG